MLSIKKMFTIGAFALLSACGSSGGGGGPAASGDALTVDTSGYGLQAFSGAQTAAAADTSNVQSLSVGATVATKKVMNGLAAPIPSPVGASSVEQEITARSLADIQMAVSQVQIPVGFTEVEQCSGGGSITINAPGISQDATTAPPSGTIEAVYTNCIDGGTMMDGYVVFSYTGGWDVDNEDLPENYTITFDIQVEATGFYAYDVAGQMTCSEHGAVCSYGQNFMDNGISYRVESYDDSGDADVYARVYVGNEGYVEFMAWDISIENGQVCSGSILISDSTGSDVIEVEFPNCSTMVVNYNGETYAYDQN